MHLCHYFVGVAYMCSDLPTPFFFFNFTPIKHFLGLREKNSWFYWNEHTIHSTSSCVYYSFTSLSIWKWPRVYKFTGYLKCSLWNHRVGLHLFFFFVEIFVIFFPPGGIQQFDQGITAAPQRFLSHPFINMTQFNKS